MKQKYSPAIAVLVTLSVLSLSMLAVRAAGGRIEGKVTDQKGAAVVGATVRVTDSETNRTFTAITDAQGRYKIEALITGIYSVVVSAKGFSEARLDNIKVDEGGAALGDVRLEIAAVEAEVNVNAGSSKPNTDLLYQQLRHQAKGDQEFAGAYASVNNLILKRDAATFSLKSGEIYFVTPIEGRITGAVFIGEGQITLVPPTPNEKRSLQLFRTSPASARDFRTWCCALLIRRSMRLRARRTRESPPVARRRAGQRISIATTNNSCESGCAITESCEP